jgi:acyl carrier protein
MSESGREALGRRVVMQIEKIRQYIVDNFLFGEAAGLGDETSFLEEGIVDSTGMLELIMFLEESFHISVEDDELIPENLDSIQNVARYLDEKLIQSDQHAGAFSCAALEENS